MFFRLGSQRQSVIQLTKLQIYTLFTKTLLNRSVIVSFWLPSSCELWQVPSLYYSWKVLPVLCSSVWALNGNPWVHQNLNISGAAVPCLPEWLDFLGKFTRTESPTYSTDHPSVAVFQSNPPSRSQECNCQCSVSTQQSKSNRMMASSIDLTQAVLCLREPPSGFVRHDGEPGEYNLHFTLPGRQSLSGRHPLHILGQLMSSVCLPSSSHSPLKSPEDQGLPRHHDGSDRLTALFSNVAFPTTTPPTSSHSADRRGSIPVCSQHSSAPVPQGASPVRSSHVASIRDTLKQHDFPTSVMDMAADPLRDSSSHVYNHHWKAFAKWANDKGIQSQDLSYVTLAEYLVHLYAENKQVNTIKVHRATFASILKTINPPTAIQEDMIHNIIRRMSILRPRTLEFLPRWHLSVVLKGLMKPPFAINGSDRKFFLEFLPY